MRTLLITGGAGFIGSNFIMHWLETYPTDCVINLDTLTYAAHQGTIEYHTTYFGDRYEFVHGSVTDKTLVEEIVQRSDMIIHFAAESHVDRSIESPHTFLETNILGTNTILNAALHTGKKRVHLISTDEVFGSLPPDPQTKFHEEYPYDPRSPYSASKASSDHLARAYFTTYGLPITISNCSNNYGPFQFPEKLIPLVITRLLRDLPYPIYGRGIAIRDYLHVIDHCTAIERILLRGAPGATYCIGGDSEKTTLDVACAIETYLGKDDHLRIHTQERAGHDMRYAIDHSKITRELGWSPQYVFSQGLEQTITWYLEHRAWWEPLLSRADEMCEKYLKS